MRGKRAKQIRAHCDYDSDDYHEFKRSIKRKKIFATAGSFVNKTRRQAGVGSFPKKKKPKHLVEYSRR